MLYLANKIVVKFALRLSEVHNLLLATSPPNVLAQPIARSLWWQKGNLWITLVEGEEVIDICGQCDQ